MSTTPDRGRARRVRRRIPLRRDERGLSKLEWLGVAFIILSIIAFIPALRGILADAYDGIFNRKNAAGETETFSIAAKGILITVVSVGAFVGTVWLVLYTDVGSRLAILITGAATFGWLVIGSLLFVIYAPRGVRPANLEGLNAFQIRIPAIAMTLGSFILFMIFVVALDRYEKDREG